MKWKILSIFFSVLIGQTHVTQTLLSSNLDGRVGSATNIETGATVTNTLNANLSFLSSVLTSLVQEVGIVLAQAIADINSAITAAGHLVSDGENLIASGAGDGVSTVNTALTDTAAHALPIIENTLAPITDFCNSVCNLITNNTALLSNPIGNINEAIVGLSSTLNLADLFLPIINLISQGFAKAEHALQTVGATLQNEIRNVATSIPAAISSGLNALNAVSGDIDIVLAAASQLSNALAAQAVAGGQSFSTPVLPMTATLTNLVGNISNAINNVPQTIDNAIYTLQNSAATLVALYNVRHEEIASSLAAVGTACVNNASIATGKLAPKTIGKTGSCVTNEIYTLQNYLAQYKNLAAQYQAGIASNIISTLQETVQTSIAFKLYLLSVKFRVESCIAVTLINAAANFVPIAASAVKCAV